MNLSTGSRLTLVAVVAVLALLPVAGWLIAQAFERSALTSFDRRLDAYASTLAGRTEVTLDGALQLPQAPHEPRFEQVFSGWYWQIRRGTTVIGTSRSLWDSSLSYAANPEIASRIVELPGPRDEPLRGLVLQLQLRGQADPLELIVALPLAEVEIEVSAFQRLLAFALGSLGVMLVIVFSLQIRWGLAPLRRMEQDLQRVRSGKASHIAPDLPRDLRQVATVMNEVLAQQAQLIERARSTAGNLAHALKTPLASLRLRIERPQPDTAGLRADLAQVQRIVDHHLARAAAAGRAGGFRRTRLRDAIEPVIDAVSAMHRGRRIAVERHLASDVTVAVDAQDLQELIGNLLDNAVKWARSRVEVHALETPTGVRLAVDDDGPGIPPEARERVVARGTQLDQTAQGSGLGLAIVRDITALYGIRFTLADSAIGGLRATLEIPRADGD
jgi:signal transduction histidine kinase